jgi:hypothetical protein
MFASASSTFAPCEWHPGNSAQLTDTPSSCSSRVTWNFRFTRLAYASPSDRQLFGARVLLRLPLRKPAAKRHGGASADRIGKTYILELLYLTLKTQAVFTVAAGALALRFPPLSLNDGRRSACPTIRTDSIMHRKPLTTGNFFHVSFATFRLRGGHVFPCLSASRFISRIATICRACDLVSSRRLVIPPRRPISAR